jgi:hypothetical protein
MKTYVHLWKYLAELFLVWEMFQTKFVEKIKTHFFVQYIFYENRAIYEAMWKNMAQPDKSQMTRLQAHNQNM